MTDHGAPSPRRVLALEPWLGGSHRAFLEGWRARSRHALEVVGLPDRHWKWRMRSGAWELARAVEAGPPPAALCVSDYVDLPALYGFLPPSWAGVPALAYFHENQLTYPLRGAAEERDSGYGFTNVQTCVRAARVVFNSRFHREEFGAAARSLLGRLPTPNPLGELESALAASAVVAPGADLESIALGTGPASGPLRVLFAHRWEHDKDPAGFLRAAREARRAGAELELVLLGESYAAQPAGVAELLAELAPAIAHQGFLPSRAAYAEALGGCDLAVSTAHHEFFGVGLVEALAAGVTPLVPRRLSYPEVVGEGLTGNVLYSGGDELVRRLVEHAADPRPLRARAHRERLRERATTWSCDRTAEQLDDLVDELLR